MKEILQWLLNEFGRTRMTIYIGCGILGVFALVFRLHPEWRETYGFLFIIACIFWVIIAFATAIRARVRKKILQKIDLRLADKSSDYFTTITGAGLQGGLQDTKTELLRYFTGQVDKIEKVNAIYDAINNAGVTYKEVYIELRYLIDPTTDVSQSQLFEHI